MSKHTPGPWENERGTITAHHGVGGLIQVVAECHVYDSARNCLSGAERDDNAQLIAAAPELLEAAKAAKGRLAFLIAMEPPASKRCVDMMATDDMLRAAIAKAEGR